MGDWCNNKYNDSIWYGDSFSSREKAIADGVQQYKDMLNGFASELFDDEPSGVEPPSIFRIGELYPFVPYVDAERIIEDIQEQAYNCCGEAAEDYLNWHYITQDEIDELQVGLQQVFDDWIKKHEGTIYSIENIEEIDAMDYM